MQRRLQVKVRMTAPAGHRYWTAVPDGSSAKERGQQHDSRAATMRAAEWCQLSCCCW